MLVIQSAFQHQHGLGMLNVCQALNTQDEANKHKLGTEMTLKYVCCSV